jgi:hypothetical protein
MRDEALGNIMWLLAVLTPVLGLLMWLTGRAAVGHGAAVVRHLRLKSLVLGLAGPANLLCWYLFNSWLSHIGYRSVIGYILAGLVFIIGGALTGAFSRRRRRGLDE